MSKLMQSMMIALSVFASGCVSQNVSDSVLMLVSPINHRSGGTGFELKTKKGKVTVTNKHICDLAVNSRIDASNNNNGHTFTSLKVLVMSKTEDLCLLEPLDSVNDGLPLALTSPLPGDYVSVLGHGKLRPKYLIEGEYTGYKTVKVGYEYNEYECLTLPNAEFVTNPFNESGVCVRQYVSYDFALMVLPGNSGSPAFNALAEVIGVVYAGDFANAKASVVPLDSLKFFLKENGY